MKDVFGTRKRRDAQTLVFFLLAWGTIMLLCGLAIDSGLLYLAKARLGRAVDGAALVAVGNFNQSNVPTTNRDRVALIMRNFAVANFTDLSPISTSGSTTPGGTANSYTLPNGTTGTSYTYNFNDGTADARNFKRYVQVVLNTGSGGAITSATCSARCPVQTYFIGYATYAIGGTQNVKIGGYSGPSGLVDLKVSSSAVATRNPRLIMVVIDRSASMLQPGGGAKGLPPAVVQFLDFFDTSADNIGIVSFGSSARLEMPMTTNFIIAGTNNLIDSYETNLTIPNLNEPGVDPESVSTNVNYQANYATTGIRRMKFGGDTAADDGIRLALEQMMANPGFTDPDVVKYMVIFTDGQWNASRTLVAAPGYTNTVTVPTASSSKVFLTNATAMGQSNGAPGAWIASTDLAADTNLLPVPTLSPLPGVISAIGNPATNDFANLVQDHTNDTWQSADTSGYETLLNPNASLNAGAPTNVVTTSWVGVSANGSTNYYTHYLDVWLQPGSVDYLYHSGSISNSGAAVYVSDYTDPDKHINLYVNSNDSNVLVVPGYVADGVVYDGLDLTYPDNTAYGVSGYPRYRIDNYQLQFMWPDDTGGTDANGTYYTASLQRQLMFRNYANLLTGFYVFRPDDPLATYNSSLPAGQQGIEPLITDATTDGVVGAPRPRWGLGAYYPSAGFYWPFGGETDSNGFVTNAVGVDVDPTYALLNPNSDPSGGTGQARHIAYSINMLSTNAAPEWSGELFYKSISGAGTNTTSGTTAASQIMVSSDWQNGAPSFVTAFAGISGLMSSDSAHNTNITPNPSVWRPACFNGSAFASVSSVNSITRSGSSTGGWVSDGNGHYFPNTMAWSGRPTHYYDFSQAKWISIADNHDKNTQFLQLGNWKAQEYAWHARALGVTIFTVGYGTLVSDSEQAFLAQIANATNTTAGGGSNMPYNPSQPIGEQFYSTTAAEISNDFYSVGQAINAALTQ